MTADRQTATTPHSHAAREMTAAPLPTVHCAQVSRGPIAGVSAGIGGIVQASFFITDFLAKQMNAGWESNEGCPCGWVGVKREAEQRAAADADEPRTNRCANTSTFFFGAVFNAGARRNSSGRALCCKVLDPLAW